MTKLTRAGRRRPWPGHEGERSLPQLLRDGAGVLAVRSAARSDAAIHRRKVCAERRRSPRPTAARCTPATTMARPPKPSAISTAVAPAKLPPGKYRNITGNQALAWGLMTAAKRSGCALFLAFVSDHARQRYSARAEPLQEFRRSHVSGRRRDRGDHRRRSAPRSAARWPSPPPAVPASRSSKRASAWP